MKSQDARKRGKVVNILPEFAPLEVLWTGSKPAYPSEPSARWAVRQHRKALIEGSALALSRGRLLVHPARFAQVIETESIKAIRQRESGAAQGNRNAP